MTAVLMSPFKNFYNGIEDTAFCFLIEILLRTFLLIFHSFPPYFKTVCETVVYAGNQIDKEVEEHDNL